MPPALEPLVQEILRRHPEVLAIYLFGSRAAGEAGPDSDLDLAVLAKSALPPEALWETAQVLAAQAGVDVDLVDLGSASTVLQMQVITAGKRLYCADENVCETFEDLAFSNYARLNEERAGILEDVRRRGKVHSRRAPR